MENRGTKGGEEEWRKERRKDGEEAEKGMNRGDMGGKKWG